MRYLTLFESARDAIFIMEKDRFIDCNQTAEKFFGTERRNLIGKTPYDEYSPPFQYDGRPSKEKALEKINYAYAGESQFFVWQHRRADGSLFDAEVSLNRFEIGSRKFLLAIVRDITQRKKYEEALKNSELRFRLIAENTADVIMALDMSLYIIPISAPQ